MHTNFSKFSWEIRNTASEEMFVAKAEQYFSQEEYIEQLAPEDKILLFAVLPESSALKWVIYVDSNDQGLMDQAAAKYQNLEMSEKIFGQKIAEISMFITLGLKEKLVMKNDENNSEMIADGPIYDEPVSAQLKRTKSVHNLQNTEAINNARMEVESRVRFREVDDGWMIGDVGLKVDGNQVNQELLQQALDIKTDQDLKQFENNLKNRISVLHYLTDANKTLFIAIISDQSLIMQMSDMSEENILTATLLKSQFEEEKDQLIRVNSIYQSIGGVVQHSQLSREDSSSSSSSSSSSAPSPLDRALRTLMAASERVDILNRIGEFMDLGGDLNSALRVANIQQNKELVIVLEEFGAEDLPPPPPNTTVQPSSKVSHNSSASNNNSRDG